MKKTINILLIIFAGAVFCNAFELPARPVLDELKTLNHLAGGNTMTAKDVNKVIEETQIVIPEPVKTLAQSPSPYHAAEQLKEELRLRGVFVHVTVAQMSPKRDMLVVEFPSWEVFKEVQDVFTTDDHGNLFYMGYYVRPQVPKDIKTGNVQITCVDKDKEFKITGVVNEKSAKLTPYYKDAWKEWVQGDTITGANVFEFTRYLRQNENNYSYAKFGEVYATAEYEFSIPKNVLNREQDGYFKGYFKATSEGYFLHELELNCNTGK